MLHPIVRGPQTGKKREGRGFSIDELKEVGLPLGLAKRRKIPVDLRRNTKHDENVELLRKILQNGA